MVGERPAPCPSANSAPRTPNDGVEEPIRVLLLIKGLGAGGAERIVSMSTRVGDRRAFHYEVAFLLPWKQALVGELAERGVPLHCLQGGNDLDLRWMLRLRRLIKARKPHIVHVHSPYVAGLSRLVVRSLPRRVRPRLVYTEHLLWDGYRPATRLLNALTYPLNEAVFAVSEGVWTSIPSRLRDRVQVVKHGPDTASVRRQIPLRAGVRRELGIASDEVAIGTVANFRPQKAYGDLLQAAAILLRSSLPLRFVAVGLDTDGPQLRAMRAALRLGDRFLLLGHRSDAVRIMAGCDLFVLASLMEGLSIALLEALGLGLPVVATAVPGPIELVTEGSEGLLVPASRPDLLAAAIEALARDPARRAEMGRAALRRADEFDIASAVAQIEGVYRQLA